LTLTTLDLSSHSKLSLP